MISLPLKLERMGYVTKAQCAAAVGLEDLIREAESSNAHIDVRLDAIRHLNRVNSGLTPQSKIVMAAILEHDTLGMVALALGYAPKRVGFLAAVAFDELITLLGGRKLRVEGVRTLDILPAKSAPLSRSQAEKKAEARKSFRASLTWRKMRYEVLSENAERNGGIATCELCSSIDGAMHVDHIEAISKNFDRRLDRSNLQVLCQDCNIGKLNGPAADFRKPARKAKPAKPKRVVTPTGDLPLFSIHDKNLPPSTDAYT